MWGGIKFQKQFINQIQLLSIKLSLSRNVLTFNIEYILYYVQVQGITMGDESLFVLKRHTTMIIIITCQFFKFKYYFYYNINNNRKA